MHVSHAYRYQSLDSKPIEWWLMRSHKLRSDARLLLSNRIYFLAS